MKPLYRYFLNKKRSLRKRNHLFATSLLCCSLSLWGCQANNHLVTNHVDSLATPESSDRTISKISNLKTGSSTNPHHHTNQGHNHSPTDHTSMTTPEHIPTKGTSTSMPNHIPTKSTSMTMPNHTLTKGASMTIPNHNHGMMDMPHHNADHMTIMGLVKVAHATHISVKSGPWEDPATWGGEVPGEGARVIIAPGHRIQITSRLYVPMNTIRIDGTLSFAPDQDTSLTVDTLYIHMTGTLEIGTAEAPIQQGKIAKLTIDDFLNKGFETANPSSPDYDPAKIGLGIVSMGSVQMHGQPKTNYVTTAGAMAGSQSLTLDSAPENWNAGDQVILTGSVWRKHGKTLAGAEVRTITGITGSTVYLDRPLEVDHTTPQHHNSGRTLKLQIANASRNIRIETSAEGRGSTGTLSIGVTSEKHNSLNTKMTSGPVFNNRGHMMLMGTEGVSINHAGFYHMGRSSKYLAADDSVINAEGRGTKIGLNPRARYPIHFHRGNPASIPATVKGSVVFESPGWGYVNHGSNVNMLENVAYDVVGASFSTERGDETGSFISNLSIKNIGSKDGEHTREAIDDHGHQGHGFWFHGFNIKVEDNIATGFKTTGFRFEAEGIDGISDEHVRSVAIQSFKNNMAFGGSTALFLWKTRPTQVVDIDNFLSFETRNPIHTRFSSNYRFNYPIVIGKSDKYSHIGIRNVYQTHDFTYINPHIEGYQTGLVGPRFGDLTIQGGYFNNQTDILLEIHSQPEEYRAQIEGDITFANNTNNLELSIVGMDNEKKSPPANAIYKPLNILYNIASIGKSYRVMHAEAQTPGFIPFPTLQSRVEALQGLTNQQIVTTTQQDFDHWKKSLGLKKLNIHQLVPGGEYLPANAIQPSNMKGAALVEM